jgi:23S rRNA pseudouridine1911/1915/1917 synthase
VSDLEVPQVERLDHYIIRQFPKLSRSVATRLVETGKVAVNGEIATKAGMKVRQKDKVKVDYEPKWHTEAPKIDLPVIYENKTCVVINKPVGVLSHSKGEFNPEATVATWLQGRIKNMSGERAGIVHRLDRATSGVMICAKTPDALHWLQKQFSTRKVKKTYIAIIKGAPNEEEAVIDMPIERNPKKPQTFRVGANGKSAVTAYKVLKKNDKYSMVELKPTTGRTHQLRVHLEHIGHPIVGDAFYGGPAGERLFLHAKSLEITLPNKNRETFEAPLPEEFNEIMGA